MSNKITTDDKSILFSLIYVSLGTISLFSLYPTDLFYNELGIIGILLTFPVVIISFAYRYAEPDSILPVILIQIIMFIATYFLIKKILPQDNLNKNKKENGT
jgi:hypothetical protein